MKPSVFVTKRQRVCKSTALAWRLPKSAAGFYPCHSYSPAPNRRCVSASSTATSAGSTSGAAASAKSVRRKPSRQNVVLERRKSQERQQSAGLFKKLVTEHVGDGASRDSGSRIRVTAVKAAATVAAAQARVQKRQEEKTACLATQWRLVRALRDDLHEYGSPRVAQSPRIQQKLANILAALDPERSSPVLDEQIWDSTAEAQLQRVGRRASTSLSLAPDKVDTVIFHGNCFDGMGAAWAAWHRVGWNAEYIAASHTDALPMVQNRNVAMVDICFKKDMMNALADSCRDFVVLDHHITARDEMLELADSKKVFDMDSSGAILSWEYFHPEKPIPPLLLYIEDRDLWQWKLPGSRALSAALSSLPLTLKQYDDLVAGGIDTIKRLIHAGQKILKETDRIVDIFVSRSVKCRCKLTGHPVRICHTPSFKSEIGNRIMMAHSDIGYAAMFHLDEDGKEVCVSLRSTEDRNVDVSAIAKQYGGGGHTQAAAFTVYEGDLTDFYEGLPVSWVHLSRLPRSSQNTAKVDFGNR